MSLTTGSHTSTVIDLLVRGSRHRDGWVPVRGSIDSGFELPRLPVAREELTAPVSAAAEVVEAASHQLALLQKEPDVEILSVFSDRYPRQLKDLNGRPSLLFLQGEWVEPLTPVLAIAGSRKAGPAARKSAYEVGRAVAGEGHVVVSGLAAGIDGCAHRGALDAGGRTIAVMGTGLGVIYPKSNEPLAHRIARQGAVVSQFPPGQGPSKTSFPARNAVIAGLAHVSLLVDMSEQSGSMIEAKCSLSQRKPTLLWAPRLADRPWAQELVDERGAMFVSSAADVLEVLANCRQ